MAEFEYRGTAAGTGGPATVPRVFVLAFATARFVESRDYIDHRAGARARAQLNGLAGR